MSNITKSNRTIVYILGAGASAGRVKTKGKEVKSWPDTTYTKTEDYSPEFNFNSTIWKVLFWNKLLTKTVLCYC